MTRVLNPEDLDEVCKLVQAGEIVAFPTDTVYGIGIRFDMESAVEKMKEAKRRDAGKPFPLMVATYEQLRETAYDIEPYEAMIRRFMPGALTIVVRRKPVVPAFAVNYKDTVAIRMPDDPWCLELLKKAGPMLVTSANLSGEKAADTEQEVLEQLDGRIAAVVRGHAKSGIASTIVDLTKPQATILRQGQITEEMLAPYLSFQQAR